MDLGLCKIFFIVLGS